jgi:mRNA interferase HigB
MRFVESRVPRGERHIVKKQLDGWYAVASKSDWKTSAELKTTFASASIISAERVVFNIKGNDYRLVVSIDYGHGSIFIKWLGTHAEYDQIDVLKVEHTKERYADIPDSK